MACLYNQSGDLFVPTDYAVSPWHPGLLHGGSVAALFGHQLAIHGEALAGFQLSRQTLNLLRPVPRAPLSLRAEPLREGKRLHVLQLSLYAGQRLVARSESLWQRQQPVVLPDYAPQPRVLPSGPAGLADFSIQKMLDDKGLAIPEGFHSHIPVTPWNEQGESTSWLRWPHAIVDHQPVPELAHVCLVSDLGNGTGQLNFGNRVGAINADITLSLVRYPESAWLALSSRALFCADGVGVVQSTVYDERGEIGAILQSVQPNGEFSG